MPVSLDGLIEPKTLSILHSLTSKPNQMFHLHSLAKASKVPVTSTARIVKKLVQSGFIQQVCIGKISVYKLADNEKVRVLKDIL